MAYEFPVEFLIKIWRVATHDWQHKYVHFLLIEAEFPNNNYNSSRTYTINILLVYGWVLQYFVSILTVYGSYKTEGLLIVRTQHRIDRTVLREDIKDYTWNQCGYCLRQERPELYVRVRSVLLRLRELFYFRKKNFGNYSF